MVDVPTKIQFNPWSEVLRNGTLGHETLDFMQWINGLMNYLEIPESLIKACLTLSLVCAPLTMCCPLASGNRIQLPKLGPPNPQDCEMNKTLFFINFSDTGVLLQ